MYITGSFVECYDYSRDIPEFRRNVYKKRENVGKRVFRARDSANIARLRSSFKRLVQANLVGGECPLLLTLTLVEDLPVAEGFKLFTQAAQRFRRDFGGAFKYVAIPEFGRRNSQRLHFHVLAWGIPEIAWKNERDNRTLQNIWALGYVDCLTTDGSPKLAGYIGKYMRKGMLDERLAGSKAYSTYGRIVRPVLLGGSSLPFAHEIWGIDLSTASPLRERHFDTQWLGGGRYTSYQLES